MGSRLSRSRQQRNNEKFSRNKKSFRLPKRSSNVKYGETAMYENEPAYCSLPFNTSNQVDECDELVYRLACLTHENESAEEKHSILPSLPDRAKHRNAYETTGTCSSAHGKRRLEAAPNLVETAEFPRHSLLSWDYIQSELCLVDEKGTGYLVGAKEQPSGELCQGKDSAFCYASVKTIDHCAEVQPPQLQPPNDLETTEPEYIYASVNLTTNESTDDTYLRIDSADVTVIDRPIESSLYQSTASSETDEVDGDAADALPNNNESEETGFNGVHAQPTEPPGNDYVRTDFNRKGDVLAGTNPHSSTRQPPVPTGHHPYIPHSHVFPQSKTPRTQAGVALFPVPAGTKFTLSGATVEVPNALFQNLPMGGAIEVGWSSSSLEYATLVSGQRPLTRVLHCLPHGSTFASPVMISLDLALTDEGQVEVFYSPTDVGQYPVWTKLRATDAPANTRFTDDNLLHRNLVTIDRTRRVARFELRHFCAFFVVENGRMIEAKKTRATLLAKTEFWDDYCCVMVRVVLGCLEDCVLQKMMEKQRSYRADGFRTLDNVEFDLFAGGSRSLIFVKISQIQWIPTGNVTNGNLDAEKFGLHQLWNDGTAGAMFWQWSQMTNRARPKAFAATVHIQQDDRQELQTKIFCNLESPLPLRRQLQVPLSDYALIRRCERLDKVLPSCESFDVPGGSAVRGSFPSSDFKVDIDLHSNSSEPEVKGNPAKPLDHPRKGTEAEPIVEAANGERCLPELRIE